ncbi:hypothetical protein PsorP6_015375 [Peronosclerospora sorghi]|uniref:Uncharacterized protein n=1 Tax=Peronosclerospora sorghi TaxID=230839 RepID=A0ACC0WQ24_9STRA|nr:hypothetical protein PsorP6_015375 [Peronosclerospora sorghi]
MSTWNPSEGSGIRGGAVTGDPERSDGCTTHAREESHEVSSAAPPVVEGSTMVCEKLRKDCRRISGYLPVERNAEPMKERMCVLTLIVLHRSLNRQDGCERKHAQKSEASRGPWKRRFISAS